MNASELTKPEKKLARQIIDKGLEIEYKNGIKKQSAIIKQWEQGKIDDKDAYMKLYKSVISHDKHISRRYNDMRGSTYLFIIAGLLADGVISLEEIDKFGENTKSRLILQSRINEPDKK
jgi:hypothetical protein